MNKEKIVRIGNAGGFWGDDPEALKRQVIGGNLDYITADYLAEITMSILQKQRKALAAKGKEGGYVTDFIKHLMEVAKHIKSSGTKIITNAGGINPRACARELDRKLKEVGIQFRIGIIEGDDIFDTMAREDAIDDRYANMETGEAFACIKGHLESANVYLGVAPIVELLKQGAEIIIAGRVTDTSLVMAPAVFEHGWALDDCDKLASSLIAGHILECGAQATGGNYTDWQKIEKWEEFGFPIAEIHEDGGFIITKHEGSGGKVTTDTVREQLLYEMGDPKNYISPDVVTDFTTLHVREAGSDRVKVEGARGFPPTPYFKVSMAYRNGFTASGAIIVSDPDCKEKADVLKDTFWKRLGIDFEKKHTSLIGLNSCHGSLAKRAETNEILLQFGVYDHARSKLEKFSSSLASLILTGPAGLAVTSGRPRIRNVVSYWPCLIEKKDVKAKVSILDEFEDRDLELLTGQETSLDIETNYSESSEKEFKPWQFRNGKRVRIIDLCLARSGDKGNMANIGVIARNETIYEFIKGYFTAGFIKHIFQEFCRGKVIRYELDNLMALNFLLEESLDGGGTQSLMVDAQGKTFASALLNCEVEIPIDLYTQLK